MYRLQRARIWLRVRPMSSAIEAQLETALKRIRQFQKELGMLHVMNQTLVLRNDERNRHVAELVEAKVAFVVKSARAEARVLMLETLLETHYPYWETCPCKTCKNAVKEYDVALGRILV